jgi:AraC-like DNA-binding protein
VLSVGANRVIGAEDRTARVHTDVAEPANSQTFRERLPSPRLARHVTCVWIQEVFADSAPYTHHTVPNGSAELVCELGGVAKVVGPQTGPTAEIVAPGTTIVGVRFRPGAAPAVLGLPAREFVDAVVGSDQLWDALGVELSERIAGSGAASEAASMLEAAVFARLAEGPRLDAIVAETVQRIMCGQMEGVGSLASSLKVSERQLRRRCEAAIGVTPKVLERMVRFQGFLALAGRSEHPTAELGRLALEAGYSDQAHLSRESRRLTGRTPLSVLHEAKINCGAAHDHGASYEPMLRSAQHRSAWRRLRIAHGRARRRRPPDDRSVQELTRRSPYALADVFDADRHGDEWRGAHAAAPGRR